MKRRVVIFAMQGLMAAGVRVWRAGFAGVFSAVLRIGLSGFLLVCLVLRLVGWIASGAGTWIAFRLKGAQVSLTAVIALDGLLCAVRSSGFAVPNALGVQEAACALFAPLLGVGSEIGLAISLIKRRRDIAIGIPVLLFWQALEGHRGAAATRAEGQEAA
jgi:hypothetical protein